MNTTNPDDNSVKTADSCEAQGAESELGRKLREIRRRYIEEGGTLLTLEEFEAELAERRGGLPEEE